MTVQEFIEENVPEMPLGDICEIEAAIENLGQDPDNPDLPTLIELIEEQGYVVGENINPEEEFGNDEPSEDDF